jgi:hypothetical protein
MRFKRVAAMAATTTLAVGGVTFASAYAGGSSNDSGSQDVRWQAVTVQSNDNIDLGASGFSLGDEQVFSDDLYAEGERTASGTDGGVCTVVRIDRSAKTPSGTAQCVVTLSLPDGQITVQGLVTFSGDQLPAAFDLAITGGTGAYSDASGTVTVEEISDTKANLTLHLTDDSDDANGSNRSNGSNGSGDSDDEGA